MGREGEKTWVEYRRKIEIRQGGNKGEKRGGDKRKGDAREGERKGRVNDGRCE